MGQLEALLYKQWILTKRQKLSFCCQIFTPMFSLALIWAVIYVVKNTDIIPTSQTPTAGFDPDGVIPTYIYAGYLANARTWNVLPLFDNYNEYRCLKYGVADPGLRDDVDYFLSFSSLLTDFKLNDSVHTPSPQYNFSDYQDNLAMNKVSIKDLISASFIKTNQLDKYRGVADACMLFKDVNDQGLDLEMQVNNLVNPRMHRANGITYMYMRSSFNMSARKLRGFNVPTEGYIGTMNYLNNKFIQMTTGQNRSIPSIFPMVSLTVDSTMLYGFIDAGLAGLSIIFFPVALSMGFPLLLYSLAVEKEEKILDLLQINGLRINNYWKSIYIFYFTLFTVVTTLFSVLGWIFIDATFFTKVDKIILSLFFLGWNLSQISFGIFLSIIIKSSIYANLTGYLLSVLMTLAFSGISFSVFPNPSKMPYYFYIIPHSAYIRFFYSITFDCFNTKCASSVWELQGDSLASFLGLSIAAVSYGFLAYLLHQGTRISVCKSKKGEGEDNEENQSSLTAKLTPDPEEEQEQIDSSMDPNFVIVANKLTKIYPNGKKALNDFTLNIMKNKIFGLLGPNGAGKTTFLSILTGALDKTSGLVYFEGKEVIYGERNDSRIGFCPQFDILWPSLTVAEHIKFFTKFKNFKPDDMDKYVKSLLAAVDLDEDDYKRADQLSGGMRRRVSLCCAVTGEPSVIFLDEPSSGLDPVRRREFWELIKKVGVGKAVVLTTHLMEEADVLCDEIAIMLKGEVKAVGTSLTLKERFSSGMKMQIVVNSVDTKPVLLTELKKFFPKMEVTWEFDKTLTITLGSGQEHIKHIFEIASNFTSQGLITDWSIMQGSLEEVFLTVVRKFGGSPTEEEHETNKLNSF